MAKGVASPSYIFPTKDGKWVVIVASTQKTWERLASAMGRRDLLEDPRFHTNFDRVAHDEELCQKMCIRDRTITGTFGDNRQ